MEISPPTPHRRYLKAGNAAHRILCAWYPFIGALLLACLAVLHRSRACCQVCFLSACMRVWCLRRFFSSARVPLRCAFPALCLYVCLPNHVDPLPRASLSPCSPCMRAVYACRQAEALLLPACTLCQLCSACGRSPAFQAVRAAVQCAGRARPAVRALPACRLL